MLGVVLATASDKAHELIGLNSLLFVSIVCVCLFLGYSLKKHKVFYLPESGAAMLFGLLIGGLITLAGRQESESVSFKPEVFFFGLLPPIIFEAGFTLKRRNFFRNMTSILMFAVLGTVVSTLVIAYGLFGLAKAGIVPLNANDPLECLMFGSLISAVDPVATLAILGSDEINADPLLYSLVFGESVLNDAVSIVLFKTFEGYAVPDSGDDLEDATAWDFIGTFLGVSIGSIAIGVATALTCSFLLKQGNLKSNPGFELTLLLLFAYGTYCIAEITSMSGIVSLFFCGIVLAHYAFYNVSRTTQTSSHHVFKSFAMIAETFVFAYLGIYAGIHLERLDQSWSVLMILFTVLLCFIARAANIFPFAFIANLRRKRKISFKMQVAMWFAGLRGAIAFALAINVPAIPPSTTPNSYIVTTTLTIVFFTTLVCGGLTEPLLRKLDLRGAVPHHDDDGERETNELVPQLRQIGYWRRFDDRIMKRFFGGQTREKARAHGDVVHVDTEDFRVHLPEADRNGESREFGMFDAVELPSSPNSDLTGKSPLTTPGSEDGLVRGLTRGGRVKSPPSRTKKGRANKERARELSPPPNSTGSTTAEYDRARADSDGLESSLIRAASTSTTSTSTTTATATTGRIGSTTTTTGAEHAAAHGGGGAQDEYGHHHHHRGARESHSSTTSSSRNRLIDYDPGELD